MSTAVLISGQMRTFAQCVANQHWMVFRHLKDPTFFISCADDEQARDAYMLEAYYPGKVHVEIVKQPDDLPAPPYMLAAHAPYAPTPNNPSVVKSIMRQLWHYRRAWEFMCEKATRLNLTTPTTKGPVRKGDLVLAKDIQQTPVFDTYVRCRPDLFFHGYASIDDDLPFPDQFFGPWKATCGGVNDRFSIMGAKAAEAYFNVFDGVQALIDTGCPLHPESIQYEALREAGCFISNTLQTEFTCLRLPGAGSHVPLVEYPGELASFIAAHGL